MHRQVDVQMDGHCCFLQDPADDSPDKKRSANRPQPDGCSNRSDEDGNNDTVSDVAASPSARLLNEARHGTGWFFAIEEHEAFEELPWDKDETRPLQLSSNPQLRKAKADDIFLLLRMESPKRFCLCGFAVFDKYEYNTQRVFGRFKQFIRYDLDAEQLGEKFYNIVEHKSQAQAIKKLAEVFVSPKFNGKTIPFDHQDWARKLYKEFREKGASGPHIASSRSGAEKCAHGHVHGSMGTFTLCLATLCLATSMLTFCGQRWQSRVTRCCRRS